MATIEYKQSKEKTNPPDKEKEKNKNKKKKRKGENAQRNTKSTTEKIQHMEEIYLIDTQNMTAAGLIAKTQIIYTKDGQKIIIQSRQNHRYNYKGQEINKAQQKPDNKPKSIIKSHKKQKIQEKTENDIQKTKKENLQQHERDTQEIINAFCKSPRRKDEDLQALFKYPQNEPKESPKIIGGEMIYIEKGGNAYTSLRLQESEPQTLPDIEENNYNPWTSPRIKTKQYKTISQLTKISNP